MSKTIVNPKSVVGGIYVITDTDSPDEPLIYDENEYFDFLCKVGYAYFNEELFNLPQLISIKGKNVFYIIDDFEYGINDGGELLGFRFQITVINFYWESDTNSFLTNIRNKTLQVHILNKTINIIQQSAKVVRIATDNI